MVHATNLVTYYLRLLLDSVLRRPRPEPDADVVERPEGRAQLALPAMSLVPDPSRSTSSGVAAVLPPISVDEHGVLSGDKVVQVPSKRRSPLLTPAPVMVVWHWTATARGTGLTCAKRSAPAARGKSEQHSAHLWVEADGTVYQSVPCLHGSWHAGGPSSARFRELGREWVVDASRSSKTGANALSVGVELVNVGEVRLVKPGATRSSAWVPARPGDRGAVFMGWPYGRIDGDGKVAKGSVVPDSDVAEAVDRSGRRRTYHAFTPEQVAAAARIVRALSSAYGISRSAFCWGHVDVDPSRKQDPGPLWYADLLPRVLDDVFGEVA